MLCEFLLYSKVNQLYTYIPSLLNIASPPIASPRSSWSPELSSLGYTALPTGCFTQDKVHVSTLLSDSFHLPLPPTLCPYVVAWMVKRLPAMWETRVQSLGWEDTLEKEMATHSSILAWKTPWMEERHRLQSVRSQRVGHDWATSLHFTSILCTCISVTDLQIGSSWPFF